MDRPLVTIVTPSYNMARYLECAIESVLSQEYPAIEYIIMDGGSNDGTVDLLEKYQGRLRYFSQPDHGAADAIGRGFALARGSILAWLSADDFYLPGAVSAAVEALQAAPTLQGVYGRAWWVDESGRRLAPYPVEPFDPARLAYRCFICQPACFFRRQAYQHAGGINPGLQSAFDYDLWIRMAASGAFRALEPCLANSRMHRSNKTLGQRKVMFQESMLILKRHFDYVPAAWDIGYAAYLLNGKDQFFDPVRPSLSACLLALAMNCWRNRTHPWRCGRYWTGEIMQGIGRRFGHGGS